MASNNDITPTLLNLLNRVLALENEVKEIKEKQSNNNLVESKQRRSTKTLVEKPKSYPKDATPVHHKFAELLKNSGETADIRKKLEEKYPNDPKGLEAAVKKAISRKFAEEKGHKQFDEKTGKPTDKLKDESLYTTRVKKLFDEFHESKALAKKTREEFDKTPEGIEYNLKAEEAKKLEGKAPKKSSKKESKLEIKSEITQVGNEFSDLTQL